MKSLSMGNVRTRVPQRDVTEVLFSALSTVALGNDTTRQQIAATRDPEHSISPQVVRQTAGAERQQMPCAARRKQASGRFFLPLQRLQVVSFPLQRCP